MDKKAFRFIGTDSLIGDLHISRFGQVIELTDDEAAALVANHPPALIVSPEGWAASRISDQELSLWPSVVIHDQAPADFIAKRDAVWKAAAEYRQAVCAGFEAAEAAVAPVAK